MRVLFATLAVSLLAATAGAAVTSTTIHGLINTSLDGEIEAGDVISGMIATELPGDMGWHPANTSPSDQLSAFTDDAGALSGLTGLLNDFPGAGNPAKLIQYDLPQPTDIPRVHILTGNAGNDGRVFSTTVVRYSTDNGSSYTQLGYFQSDPSGTINTGQWGSTLVEIFDDTGADLVTGATNLQFDFYSVDNTMGEMRDPFDGINPFTAGDDALTAAFVSPLLYEIDVIPEPSTLTLLALGLVGLVAVRRWR